MTTYIIEPIISSFHDYTIFCLDNTYKDSGLKHTVDSGFVFHSSFFLIQLKLIKVISDINNHFLNFRSESTCFLLIPTRIYILQGSAEALYLCLIECLLTTCVT